MRALQRTKGNFDMQMEISRRGAQDLDWWIRNAGKRVRDFTRSPSVQLVTDASNTGWGAVRSNKKAQGKWLESEQEYHINERELLAVLFGLKTFCRDLSKTSIRVLSDNATTVSYINRMGGVKSPRCNRIAHQIWVFCEDKNCG